jgi:uncharacterized protein (DUF1499 family)
MVAVLIFSGCAAMTERSVGLVGGALTDCPRWPRCVSSQATDPDKRVAPYRVEGDIETAWRQAQAAVSAMPRTQIVDLRARYLRAEVVSPWHVYTDDLELLLYPDEELIDVRSSARIGYYDFNVNRDRVEALRADLAERGVIASQAMD